MEYIQDLKDDGHSEKFARANLRAMGYMSYGMSQRTIQPLQKFVDKGSKLVYREDLNESISELESDKEYKYILHLHIAELILLFLVVIHFLP